MLEVINDKFYKVNDEMDIILKHRKIILIYLVSTGPRARKKISGFRGFVYLSLIFVHHLKFIF